MKLIRDTVLPTGIRPLYQLRNAGAKLVRNRTARGNLSNQVSRRAISRAMRGR